MSDVEGRPAHGGRGGGGLRDVVDPELGINVVDLGLVYGVTIDANSHAAIDMTLTSAACPLTDVIEDQASQALEGLVAGSTSTGCGCRRGGRTRSPRRAGSKLRALWLQRLSPPGEAAAG
jgi:hypothetical protein